MHRSVRPSAALTLLLLAAPIGMAGGHGGNDVAKYRHSIMELMAGHMNALAMIARGKVDQGEFTQSHADALASAAMELDALFPEGSGEGTHALPAIWENADAFAAAIAESKKAGAALRDAAASGDPKALMPAFGAFGKSCKDCHEGFREEHDD